MVGLQVDRRWIHSLPLSMLLLLHSGSAYSNPDLGTRGSAGVILTVLGLAVLLLGLHHLRDLRSKTLTPPGYRGRAPRRDPPKQEPSKH